MDLTQIHLESSLQPLFNPKSVAVIGATERHGVGRTLLFNLLKSPFNGVIYPVNPTRKSVHGIRAYPSISQVPDTVDLAIIVTPAKTVPALVKECAESGCKGCVIVSAGFAEMGEPGLELERQILEHKGTMRIIGPNCLGIMSPVSGLNATFAATMAKRGRVAFLSQSGALCTSILDYSMKENLGFSAFVSVGSMLDVDYGDLIDHFGSDPETDAIVFYSESIGNPQKFFAAARQVALTKPIIVIKAGATDAGASAAASHTGALTGSDDVLTAMFERCGVLRVSKIADLFYMAGVLSKQPRPKGNRMTIISNAGGPAVLSTDALISKGGQLTTLETDTIEKLNSFLPHAWSHGNPIDVLGDSDETRYAKTLAVVASDPNADGILVILTPQDMSNPTETAQALVPYANIGKPVLASWMGGETVAEGARLLSQAGIPNFPFPDQATDVFNYMYQYHRNLCNLYEEPTEIELTTKPDKKVAVEMIAEAYRNKREIMSEYESKALLAAYGIPVCKTVIATTADEAAKAAEDMGYPVVVKIHSEIVTHKSDVGGVRLNIRSADEVRECFETIKNNVQKIYGSEGEHFLGVTVQQMISLKGYEVIIGASVDPLVGPIIVFGSGGTLVEVYRDTALTMPPVTNSLARQLMQKTKIYTALQGVRGEKSVDLEKMDDILVRFSQLITNHPEIAELDINPLIASADGIVALDARVLLHPHDKPQSEIAKPIDGITFRPIKPTDDRLVKKFSDAQATRPEIANFFKDYDLTGIIAHTELSRMCFIDYERDIAFVVIDETNQKLYGISRLTNHYGTDEVEMSIVVSSDAQNKHIGTTLIEMMKTFMQARGLKTMNARVPLTCTHATAFLQKKGFVKHSEHDGVAIYKLHV
ncbi:hypothetical protein GEMRC1_014154 [Eukaryota sp. GEM-RC1]